MAIVGAYVGRSVQYVTLKGDIRAAIIVKVLNRENGACTLYILPDAVQSDEPCLANVLYDENSKSDSWHMIRSGELYQE